MSQDNSEAEVFQRAPMYSDSEHFTPGLVLLSNDPLKRGDSRPKAEGNASDESNPYTVSGSEHSKEDTIDQPSEKNVARPHEITRSLDHPESILMSWWPESELVPATGIYSQEDEVEEDLSSHAQRPANKKRESFLERLESGFGRVLFGAHGYGHGSTVPKTVPEEDDGLFHVVFTSSHFKKDVNSNVQAVRICGTYTTISAAKAYAHRSLFEAGYEQEWFTSFKTQHDGILIDSNDGTIIQAVGPDGENFTVSVATTPNYFALKPNDSRKIEAQLYHVVQTTVNYAKDESGQARETKVKASFPNYEEARKVALHLLLSDEQGISKENYAEYDEAGPGELDCGYGENVVVHAAGENGENILVSVLKGQEMESLRVTEAAMAMR